MARLFMLRSVSAGLWLTLGWPVVAATPVAPVQLAAPVTVAAPVASVRSALEIVCDELYAQAIAPDAGQLVDIAATERNLQQLDLLLTTKLSADEVLLGRYIRGLVLFHLAGRRYEQDLPADLKASRRGLEDIEYVLQHARPFSPQLLELAFNGGKLALNHLQMYNKAVELWTLCGTNGHAGCMTELATFHFTGEFGIEQNLNKAIQWHQKIVATGLQYRCAAILSTSFLAQLSFFKSKLSTGKTAEQWWQQMENLSYAVSGNSGEEDKCGINDHHLLAYVLKRSANLPVAHHWQQLQAFSHDEAAQQILSWYVEPSQAERALSAIDTLSEDYYRSTAWYAMLLHAHFTGQTTVYRQALRRLESQDPVYAEPMLSWVSLLRADSVLP